MEKLLEYDSYNYTALYYIVLCCDCMEKYDMGKEAALELVRNYPESSQAYGLCARIFVDNNECREAVDYCKEAIKLNTDNADHYYIMSFALRKIRGKANLYTVANLILKALKIEPNNVEFHVQACAVYVYIGEYYKANEEGKKALQLKIMLRIAIRVVYMTRF